MRRFRAFALASIAACVTACGGQHSASLVPVSQTGADSRQSESLKPSSQAAVYAIDSGCTCTPPAGFSADVDFVGYGGAGTDATAVDVSAPNSAPAGVYSTYRTSSNTVTYVLPQLTPNAPYHGALYFEEPLVGGIGRRVQSVNVGGNLVDPALDIFALTGKTHKAVAETFAANASASGQLQITITPLKNDAILSGFSVYAGSIDPASPAIDAGGPVAGTFAADAFSVGYSGAGQDPVAVDVSDPHSAPAAIYATYRTAPKTLTYALTGLLANTTYQGYLYFDEPLLGGIGRRVMNVTAGGQPVISGLDIFALAGKTHKAVNIPVTATSDANGALPIVLTATANDTIVSGFSLHATGAGSVPTSTPAPAPSVTLAPLPAVHLTGDVAIFGFPQTVGYTSGLVNGPDGAIWFPDFDGSKIGRISMAGVVTEFADAAAPLSQPWALTAGPDGALWFTELTGQIGRVTTQGQFTMFTVPNPAPGTTMQLNGIAAGSDGALWFIDATTNAVWRMTTAGAFTRYPLPTANALPQTIAAGPDGALWFTEYGISRIGRITTSGALTEFTGPITYLSGTPGNAHLTSPTGLAFGPNDTLWFGDDGSAYNTLGSNIGTISSSGLINEYANVTNGEAPYMSGAANGLLFADSIAFREIDTTGKIVWAYEAQGSERFPTGVVVARDGSVWGTVQHPNEIYRFR